MFRYLMLLSQKKISPEQARVFLNNTNVSKRKKYRILSKAGIVFEGESIITPPFFYEFGNVILQENVFINSSCVFLDNDCILIGRNSLIGPNVSLCTISHAIPPIERHTGTYTGPIHIGQNVWIGAGTVVLPNVIIGDNSIIGANSVVKSNVPANTIYAGAPAIFRKSL